MMVENNLTRLPTHRKDAICIKCGCDQASIEYLEKAFVSSLQLTTECLLRTCSRCGYAWYEECIDSGEPVNKNFNEANKTEWTEGKINNFANKVEKRLKKRHKGI